LKLQIKDILFGLLLLFLLLYVLLLSYQSNVEFDDQNRDSMIPASPPKITSMDLEVIKGEINVFTPSIGNYIRLLDSEEISDTDLSQHSNESALPTYWQLQAGPLTNEDAKRMANQLRNAGFKVFVEKTSDNVEEYFVMIGPKLSKERILTVKNTLQKDFELETQIFIYVYED
tara:strand:- start:692 stop:1210 length:519 start_codon:yes stop_codon:yes gene_type:complete